MKKRMICSIAAILLGTLSACSAGESDPADGALEKTETQSEVQPEVSGTARTETSGITVENGLVFIQGGTFLMGSPEWESKYHKYK